MEKIEIVSLSLEDFRNMLSEIVRENVNQFGNEPSDELITVNEAVERLKISKPTLHKYAELGILIRHKLGNRIYYRWSEILAAAKRIESRELNSGRA